MNLNLCPLPRGLSQDTAEKSLAPYSLLSHQIFIHSLSLFLYKGWYSPFDIFVACSWTCSSMSCPSRTWDSRNGPRSPWTTYSGGRFLDRHDLHCHFQSYILLCVVGQCPSLSFKTSLPFFIQTQDMTKLDLSFFSSVRNILFFQKKLQLPVWMSGCRDGCV